jgi:hypothetical protein
VFVSPLCGVAGLWLTAPSRMRGWAQGEPRPDGFFTR